MEEKYDVIIIGAGPAGLSCAEILAGAGRSVLVLEKNKEIGPKICAGGLTKKVENLGIPFDLADRAFSSVKFHFSEKSKNISYFKQFIATIDRKKLGKILVEKAIKAGAKVKNNIRVEEVNNNFVIANNKSIKFNYLVGADGSNSIVRKFLGLKIKKIGICFQYKIPVEFKNLEIFYNCNFSPTGYAYIFPHNGYTFLGIGIYSTINHTGKLKPFKIIEIKKIFESWLKSKNIKIKGSKIEFGIINFDYRGFQFGNKFLIGDAGGFAFGPSGEGIYSAIVSGKEAAKKILDKNYGCRGIRDLLKMKAKNEWKLKFLLFLNNPLTNFYLKSLLFLFNFKWLSKYWIKKNFY